MSSKKDAWGVEVGAQAIKAMKLARTATGVELVDFDVMPFKHVLTMPDINVEEAIRVNLEALAQKHEFERSTVAVSVPGNMAFARFAKLPPVEAKNVKSIVAYEAQQQIPFPIDEVEWDYEVFAQDDAPDIEVGIFAITKERVAHFLSNYRSVGVRVDTLTLSPVAVYNAFAYENEAGAGFGDNTVYLDIGTTSTDIIIVESGSIWLRTLQLGGNHFTQALMKQLKISFAKAEKLKLEAATSKYAKHIFQATRGVMGELVNEIQRSLGFYTSMNRDAELKQIVGVGSTWKLPGLQKYLKQNLQMKVLRPDGYSQINAEDRRDAEFSSVAGNMATAYGLALQGLGLSVVDANILPQSILQQRMWKAKQPWVGAAAACAVGAPLIGTAMLFLNSSGYDSAMSTVEPKVNATVTEGRQYLNEYKEVQTSDPGPGIRNFRRSFDYSDLAPKLMEDVASAMAMIKPNPEASAIDWNDQGAVERLALIPRQNRDMLWMTDIETVYLPPVAAEPTAVSRSGSSPELSGGVTGGNQNTLGQIFPQIPFPSKSESQAVDSNDVDNEAEGDQQPKEISEAERMAAYASDPSPRIQVTVSGVTTMDRSKVAKVLKEDFAGWLKENAERSDRPYILVPELSPPKFGRRGAGSGTTGGGGLGSGTARSGMLSKTPSPKAVTQPAGPSSGGLLPGGGLGAGPEGARSEKEGPIEIQTPEGWYTTIGSGTQGFSANVLLPRRPLSTEDDTQDVVFEFTFEVILLNPDEARKSILAEDQPDDAEQGGEAVSQAEASQALQVEERA